MDALMTPLYESGQFLHVAGGGGGDCDHFHANEHHYQHNSGFDLQIDHPSHRGHVPSYLHDVVAWHLSLIGPFDLRYAIPDNWILLLVVITVY